MALRRLMASLAFVSCLVAATASHARDVVVRQVEDGDTLTALADGRPLKIRLVAIDAPENGQPGGREAKAALRRLVEGRQVSIVEHGPDRYGRTLAEVYVAGVDVGMRLVQAGHAWRYREQGPYGPAEASARAAGRGLWAASTPIPPWDWRKGAGPTVGQACGAVRRCNQARTCADARAALACGFERLDQDGDGVPCESLCRH